jgi:protein-S-isoprenylcysteine O-methyltransferase Ste14
METEYAFHTTVFFLLVIVVALRMYNSGYADAKSGVTQTTKGEGIFTLVRITLGIPVGLAFLAYLAWPPLMQWASLDFAPEIRWIGLPLAILSVALLISVHKHLSQNFTGTVQIRPEGKVVQTGPYAYVRHPMYWSFILFGIGLTFLTSNWFLGGGFLLVILIVMIVRTPVEEKALRDAYGAEYDAYAKRVGKFVPKLFRN